MACMWPTAWRAEALTSININISLLININIYPNNTRDVYLYIYSVSAYIG